MPPPEFTAVLFAIVILFNWYVLLSIALWPHHYISDSCVN